MVSEFIEMYSYNEIQYYLAKDINGYYLYYLDNTKTDKAIYMPMTIREYLQFKAFSVREWFWIKFEKEEVFFDRKGTETLTKDDCLNIFPTVDMCITQRGLAFF